MGKTMLNKLTYYLRQAIDHLYTWWYKLFIGKVGKGTVIRRHCRLDGDSMDYVTIGKNCAIDSYFCLGARSRLIEDGKKVLPQVTIGNNCTIGQYNHITSVNKIVIGDNLLTGRFVLITDNSHGVSPEEMLQHPSCRQVVSKGEVVIGNNVWLSDKVSIMPGVHIGDGCIVGANSVVTHDLPTSSVAVGNPARVIRTIINH